VQTFRSAVAGCAGLAPEGLHYVPHRRL